MSSTKTPTKAERAQLQARLRRLELQQEAQQVEVPPAVIRSTLAQMHKTLAGDDVQAKQTLLAKVEQRPNGLLS